MNSLISDMRVNNMIDPNHIFFKNPYGLADIVLLYNVIKDWEPKVIMVNRPIIIFGQTDIPNTPVTEIGIFMAAMSSVLGIPELLEEYIIDYCNF